MLFDGIVLVGGYPSPSSKEVQQRQEATELVVAAGRKVYICSSADTSSPPGQYGPFFGVLRENGVPVYQLHADSHINLFNKYVMGGIEFEEERPLLTFTRQTLLPSYTPQ